MGRPAFRLYAHPLKQALSLLLALAFTGAGCVALADPIGSGALTAALAYALIVFFGLGALLIIATMLGRVLLRRPLLRIDSHGWRCAISPFDVQRAAWPTIASIAIYEQRLSGRRGNYYLMVEAKESARLPRPRIRAWAGRMYPPMRNAAIVLPLDQVFWRQTPLRCETLLKRIQVACGEEMERHGVRLEAQIQEL